MFERNGWEYDHIRRAWLNPDGTVILPLDTLVLMAEDEAAEPLLVGAVMKYGNRSWMEAEHGD